MINFDHIMEEKSPDHPYRVLKIQGSGSGKTNSFFNLIISHQPDIDNIYLYAKDPYKGKHQFLINKRESIVNYSV